MKGHDGNLWDNTWTNKGKRFLGYKKNETDQYIVTDLWAGSEDKDVPDGYAGLLITKDTSKYFLHSLASLSLCKQNSILSDINLGSVGWSCAVITTRLQCFKLLLLLFIISKFYRKSF